MTDRDEVEYLYYLAGCACRETVATYDVAALAAAYVALAAAAAYAYDDAYADAAEAAYDFGRYGK